MFIGEYTHNIDDKKRISLPIKFRKELGKKIVITRGLDNCLFAYTAKEWSAISEKLAELGMGQADKRGFNRFMLSGAAVVDVDAVGRILIPENLRDFAAIKEKVVITGAGKRMEIWNEKRWQEYQKVVLKNADLMAEKLGEIGAI